MPGRTFSLETAVIDLPLAERFTIARESWDVATNVFVTVSYGGEFGVGECSPAQRWDESAASVIAQLEALDLNRLAGPFDLEGIHDLLPPGSARCALDIAMHDLAAKLAGVSVAELLGLEGRNPPPTSLTVPIAEAAKMVERAAAHSEHPVLKMKVGFDGDVDAVAAVREVYGGSLRIDANEGWDEDNAITRLQQLEALTIELCEQPVAAGNVKSLQTIKESTSIPVFADEDVCTSADVVALAGAVDGVNLKLRKAGGIRETTRAIAVARAEGMQVMLGCDLTSGIAATAEATVARLVDFADVDGPLLLAEDPFPGVTYSNGAMTVPQGRGLGVSGVRT